VDIGDTLTWSAVRVSGGAEVALPSWLVFTPWHPHAGRYAGQCRHGDLHHPAEGHRHGEPASASVDFSLAVVNTNDAPTVGVPLLDRQIQEHVPWSFTLSADRFADIDPGDSLTWAAYPSGREPAAHLASFDPVTRTLHGTPDQSQVGVTTIRVTVKDTK
jgi:hypothetical protein